MVGAWLGLARGLRAVHGACVFALLSTPDRKDLQTIAAQALRATHMVALELDEAELLLTRALELAGESGSVRARIRRNAFVRLVPCG